MQGSAFQLHKIVEQVSSRFGIVFVDFEQGQKRMLKHSGHWYAQVAATNRFPEWSSQTRNEHRSFGHAPDVSVGLSSEGSRRGRR
ncbi:family 1 glycosylhydrolase [Microvirga zambiensis]|uniref:family 1 glycosylhydrolase n=1 Tax=Microvirga zambiensis TaxID=1402137 RepID=UPI00191D58C1